MIVPSESLRIFSLLVIKAIFVSRYFAIYVKVPNLSLEIEQKYFSKVMSRVDRGLSYQILPLILKGKYLTANIPKLSFYMKLTDAVKVL